MSFFALLGIIGLYGAALADLERMDVLVRDAQHFRFASPQLVRIYQGATEAKRVEGLARRVRQETPVFSTAQRFFAEANFERAELGTKDFLLTPGSPRERERLGADVYTRIFADAPLTAEDVRTIQTAAQSAYCGDVHNRIAFVVVDRTPAADARFQIYAFRAESGFTVIPLSHGRLRQALVDGRAAEALDTDVTPLYRQLIEQWSQDIGFKYPDLVLPALRTIGENETDADPVESFRHDLLALHGALSRRESTPQFVFMLDEVERLLPAPDGPHPGFRGYEELLATLRGVAQQHGFLVLLVASVEPRLNRTDRWGGVDNPMYRFFQEIFLPPFAATECAEMVENIGQQMGIPYVTCLPLPGHCRYTISKANAYMGGKLRLNHVPLKKKGNFSRMPI